MGCTASKQQTNAVVTTKGTNSTSPTASREELRVKDKHSKLYQLLISLPLSVAKVHEVCNAQTAAFQHPTTLSTPLHMAIRLIPKVNGEDLEKIVERIVEAHPEAVATKDIDGNIPLHYCIEAPRANDQPKEFYRLSVSLIQILNKADPTACSEYWQRRDAVFGEEGSPCSPLYRLLWLLPDDTRSSHESAPPTVEYLHYVVRLLDTTEVPNQGNGDTPLALLYRRFTRQFDLAEQLFDGDNSRKEVVHHRQRYKTAAGNTWKQIEVLLRPPQKLEKPWHLVHRAVQLETPPDLLRYIVETNAQDLAAHDDDETGNLPLHHAATTQLDSQSSFYAKYVVDELLYKYPDAASKPNQQGKLALELAVESKKSWIGGGIKSLYEAYPEALKKISLEQHAELQRALAVDGFLPVDEKKMGEDDEVDEPHDAIMLVQQPNVPIEEIVGCMWAHEEDAGVQMLGCVAISNLAAAASAKEKLVAVALAGIPAVVNALKAHPNEVIVQEKACHALALLAAADGSDEISLVASGAVTSLVGAMQAHVSDTSVQEEASRALSAICKVGGANRATMIASVSGVTALVNALAAHPKSRNVQVAAVEALNTVTGFPAANVPALARSQTEALLWAAQEAFPETEEHVSTLLSRLS